MKFKKISWICGIVLTTILIIIYIGIDMKNSEIPRDAKVEIGIKATNDDQMLKINILACHVVKEFFNRGIKVGVHLQYPRLTFTGNMNQIYYCPDKQDGFINNLSIRAAPIAGYQNLSGKFNSNDYLRNLIMNLPDAELLGEKNNIQVYETFSGIRILVKEVSSTKYPFIIKYPLIEGDITSPFLYHYNIRSMISNDFIADYTVSADNSDEVTQGIPQGLAPFPIDAEFAREFHRILITEGELGILEHPEIIQKFVENNEKVIEYIKSISKEENSTSETKSYIKIIE
ncbi:hypothetical protein PE074_09890 (plasmid) [Wohlfahrtiimonas chitiniclastica]|uniref:Uncharacterized protein n=1 Tax=Wohlfahrtiimonas chitiniclastica SH04 TaxID=1261130 RepID=L8XT30_9GAMM|nr:hypothetical protein [Wohlfahrtiimonas chitiniclastica]ELV07183.1 Hypothetical protein F387_01999 [Wohlfahrtiimonas chitiniclastica SH04]MBS7815721.1 hypothetical protein [Wohlfahrtiimonas chitiniclastica]MBS7821597.1 hypothetical protein [Wohlfahrtiimonas chitiniclastica]MBS7839163.1 hypothetical protein [Wohlfahrtiimonas chitiniclastica]WHR56410.1 hypothetical protein PE074_09890 [Wohlfahrtiimonas chitiniclastica]